MKNYRIPAIVSLALAAISAATVLSTAASAQSTAGTPIQGTPVGLEHDPEGVRIDAGRTDARGNVTASNLAPGRYTVFLTDASKLKAPVRVTVSSPGAAPLVSEPVLPAESGSRAYALDRSGSRLVVMIRESPSRAGSGGQITVNVSEQDINNDGQTLRAEPIPGIDIIVRKKPGGVRVAATVSDASGRFSVRVAEPGQYTVSTACRSGNACQPHTVSLTASGVLLKPSADGTYEFSVGARGPAVLTGQIVVNNSPPRTKKLL